MYFIAVQLSVICLVVLNLPSSVNSLMCYECFSSKSGNCGFHFVPEKAGHKNCSSLETICYKEMKSIKNIPVVTRNCGTPEVCNTIRYNCTMCNTTLCNSSFKNTSFNFYYYVIMLFSTIVLKW